MHRLSTLRTRKFMIGNPHFQMGIAAFLGLPPAIFQHNAG